MIERLIVDANAVIDLLRPDRSDPPAIHTAQQVLLPLPAVGELFAGAYHSDRAEENLAKVEELIIRWSVLEPDLDTARVYGSLRRRERPSAHVSQGRVNDLWIAALCIQHQLPLLSNDRGFDEIVGVHVLHW